MSRSIVMAKTKEKKKKHRLTKRRYSGLPNTDGRRLSEEGLLQISLSTFAQQAINCYIGDNITLENPWMYVSKEKIEDHLELHAESSDFLPFANQIHDYPEEELLIGLKKERQEDEQKDLFYICITLEMKNYILNILKEEELKKSNAIRNAIEKVAGTWHTWGSEEEITEEKIKLLRPIFITEIECEFPIFKGKRRFSLSLAYPENKQFVEILPTGRFKGLVYKRRMTISVQAASAVSNNSSQTMQICQMNQGTQYEYKVREIRVPLHKYKKLLYFLNETMPLLSDSLLMNAHMDLSRKDYILLKSKRKTSFFYSQTALKYIRDVNYGRHQFVSALVWHPRISGLVAVAYAYASSNILTKKPISWRRLEYFENVVLIWCYISSVKPKLILHADREIVSLCFCPYNVNILLGGCTNGQIVIWDLSDKLERAEQQEVMLTPKEEEHHVIIESITSWMWFSNDVLHIKPTAVSDLLSSHRDAVTTISWISSNYECTLSGKVVEKDPSNENNKENPFIGGQFMTCSADGFILFWDLKRKKEVKQTVKHKENLAIFEEVSPFRVLNNRMYPIFKISIDSPYSFLPLTRLLISDQKFMYESVNPDTGRDIYKRTYFKSVKCNYPKKFDRTLTLITGIGNIFTCTWNGYEYDPGNIINSKQAEKVTFLHWVHDAPIHICSVNPMDNNLLLTVGGKIFAVWNTTLDSRALIWRKSFVRYNSGIWSVNNIGIILLFRVDSKIEFWDILYDSKSPSRIINQTGFPTINIFLEDKLYHVTKETYFKTDKTGIIELTSLMSKDQDRISNNINNSMLLEDFSKRIVKRRTAFQEWANNWKKKHVKPRKSFDSTTADEVKIVNESEPEPKKLEITENLEEKWRKKDFEKKLFNTLMGKQNLDLREIERNKHLAMNKFEEKINTQKRLKYVLKCSEKIFESNKKNLLESYATVRKMKSLHGQQKSYLMRQELKQMYMRSYYETEKDILQEIQKEALCPDLIYLIR